MAYCETVIKSDHRNIWSCCKVHTYYVNPLNYLNTSIFDDDGEFILIETAHYLPKWIKPETVINRVWNIDKYCIIIDARYLFIKVIYILFLSLQILLN